MDVIKIELIALFVSYSILIYSNYKVVPHRLNKAYLLGLLLVVFSCLIINENSEAGVALLYGILSSIFVIVITWVQHHSLKSNVCNQDGFTFWTGNLDNSESFFFPNRKVLSVFFYLSFIPLFTCMFFYVKSDEVTPEQCFLDKSKLFTRNEQALYIEEQSSQPVSYLLKGVPNKIPFNENVGRINRSLRFKTSETLKLLLNQMVNESDNKKQQVDLTLQLYFSNGKSKFTLATCQLYQRQVMNLNELIGELLNKSKFIKPQYQINDSSFTSITKIVLNKQSEDKTPFQFALDITEKSNNNKGS